MSVHLNDGIVADGESRRFICVTSLRRLRENYFITLGRDSKKVAVAAAEFLENSLLRAVLGGRSFARYLREAPLQL
jgi:hypothetical protein